MAFTMIRQTEDGVPVYECLSTDTKKTPQPLGAVAFETDTGDKYEYRGSTAGWVNTDSSGSIIAQMSGGSTWSYGDYPHNSADTFTCTNDGASDNDLLGTFDNLENYNAFTIYNGDDATSVDFEISADGTNFTSATACVLHDATGQTTYVLTIPAGDIGFFTPRGKIKSLRIRQDGVGAITASDIIMLAGVV